MTTKTATAHTKGKKEPFSVAVGDDDRDGKDKKKILGMAVGVFIGFAVLATLWVIGGISAFIASFVCMFYSGSMIEKVLGVLLSIVVGPFYWIYFWLMKGYCSKNKGGGGSMMGGKKGRKKK